MIFKKTKRAFMYLQSKKHIWQYPKKSNKLNKLNKIIDYTIIKWEINRSCIIDIKSSIYA